MDLHPCLHQVTAVHGLRTVVEQKPEAGGDSVFIRGMLVFVRGHQGAAAALANMHVEGTWGSVDVSFHILQGGNGSRSLTGGSETRRSEDDCRNGGDSHGALL